MKIIYISALLTVIGILLLWNECEASKRSYERTKKEKQYKGYMNAGYKYAARDQDGQVFIFKSKPFKYINVWICRPASDMRRIDNIYDDRFDSVKWTDEKPKSLDDLMNGEI